MLDTTAPYGRAVIRKGYEPEDDDEDLEEEETEETVKETAIEE